MNEVWRQSASLGFDADAEATEIAALEAALDAIDPARQDEKTHLRRAELRRELFEVRSKRIDRDIRENWETLEELLGRKLRQ